MISGIVVHATNSSESNMNFRFIQLFRKQILNKGYRPQSGVRLAVVLSLKVFYNWEQSSVY